MTEVRAALERLAAAVEIDGSRRLRLAGEPWVELAGVPGSSDRERLRTGLTGHLYNRAHAGPWPEQGPPIAGPPAAPDRSFIARIIAGRERQSFDPGWALERVEAQSGVFGKRGWTRRAPLGGFIPERAMLAVPLPHAGPWNTFLFLYGATLGDGPEQGGLVRVYLHTRPPQAAELIVDLGAALDHLQIPFVLKTLMAPASVDRTDATVLYLRRRYHRVALGVVRRLGARLDGLGAATPLCGLRLRPGVAIAEDTDTSESFGRHRMRLVAEAVLDSHGLATDSPARRIEALARRFDAAQIQLSAPHLAPRSRADYRADWPSE